MALPGDKDPVQGSGPWLVVGRSRAWPGGVGGCTALFALTAENSPNTHVQGNTGLGRRWA